MGSNIIHIANNSQNLCLVMVAPNRDFIPADIAFGFIKSAAISAATAGFGSGSSVTSTVTSLTKAIKSAKDLYNIYGKLNKIYKLALVAEQKHLANNLEKHLPKLVELFQKSCMVVPTGNYVQVNVKELTPFMNIESVIPEDFKRSFKGTVGDFFGELLLPLVETHVEMPLNSAKFLYEVWNSIDPSNWLSYFGAVKDMTVFIADQNFQKVSYFNSNSDHSWIVKDTEVVRARYGSIWEEDPKEGRSILSTQLGNKLNKHWYLEPMESIDVQTVNFKGPGDFMPEFNRTNIFNVSEYEEREGFFSFSTFKKIGKYVEEKANDTVHATSNLIEGIANLPSNAFSYPYKLIYQTDGNLVLYHLNGSVPNPVWSTNTNGKPAWRVYMQDDGNFVVYSAPGVVEWALFAEMPTDEKYKNAYISLHRRTGKIGYYIEGDEDPLFYVNEKNDCFKRN